MEIFSLWIGDLAYIPISSYMIGFEVVSCLLRMVVVVKETMLRDQLYMTRKVILKLYVNLGLANLFEGELNITFTVMDQRSSEGCRAQRGC